jgi:hypothetical protein
MSSLIGAFVVRISYNHTTITFVSQNRVLKAQVTLVMRAFAICVLVYPRFYFGIMGSIDILSAATVEAAVQTH